MSFRIGGTGLVVNRLEWDVKLDFALAGATHNAAFAAWSVKRYYEGPRPITMIRYMGSKGQCGDSSQPAFNPQGLLLYPGVVEVITPESSAPGGTSCAPCGARWKNRDLFVAGRAGESGDRGQPGALDAGH